MGPPRPHPPCPAPRPRAYSFHQGATHPLTKNFRWTDVNHCRSRTLRDHRPSAARSDHFTTNGLNGYGNAARRAARPCAVAGRPFPGALRVEAAPAACASETQAGRDSPVGLKHLTPAVAVPDRCQLPRPRPRRCARAGRPLPGALRVEAAPAASAGATQAERDGRPGSSP
jgi:hypothetical protein